MMRLLFAFLFSTAILFGADLTGTWQGDAAPSVTVTLRLQQSANSLSGTEEIQGRIFPIGSGEVDGDQITFTISIPAG